MNILVTGGAGYVGSVTVEVLVAAGHRVLVLDNLSTGHRAAVHPDAEFVRAELADRVAVDRAMSGFRPDAIMHFAALGLVGASYAEPLRYLHDNILCGIQLFDSATRHGVGRIILSSTANLYGTPETVPITEDARISPSSPYGESKYALERCLFWLEQGTGCRYACLRYFNAAGASAERGEDHDPETHLIPIVLEVARGRRDHLTIFGQDYQTPDGTCVRDYVHVVDLAHAHLAALDALDGGSRVYNLGTGHGVSVRQIVSAARRITGHAIPTRPGPRRPGDPAILVASSDKIQRELGWRPRVADIDEIIASAWRWHLAYPDGYSSS